MPTDQPQRASALRLQTRPKTYYAKNEVQFSYPIMVPASNVIPHRPYSIQSENGQKIARPSATTVRTSRPGMLVTI